VRVDELAIEPNTVMTIYLEGVDFVLRLVKQIFTNGDGSYARLLMPFISYSLFVCLCDISQ
jgi:hypothetical protein